MTHPAGEVGGSDDTIIAAEPTIEDRFAAFGDEEEQQDEQPQGDAPATDTEAEPDLSDVEIDEADIPAIAPPVSWTAEEKAEFAELPRTVQETLTRREAEREKFVQSKAQEVKAATQTAEQAAAQRIAQERQTNLQTLQALLPEIPEKPPYRLQSVNPVAFAEAMDAHDNAIAQHRYVQQVANQVMAQQQQAEADAQKQEAEQGRALLQEKFPEYFDDAVRANLEPQFRTIAAALEYPADQLNTFDAHDIIRLKTVSEWKAKADKLDTLMAKKMQTVRDAKAMPKVSRPGVPVGKGAIDGQRYQADRQAMRSGDRDAGARVFSKFL